MIVIFTTITPLNFTKNIVSDRFFVSVFIAHRSALRARPAALWRELLALSISQVRVRASVRVPVRVRATATARARARVRV